MRILVLLLLWVVFEPGHGLDTYTVAFIGGLPFSAYNSAIKLALEDINNSESILPQTELILDKSLNSSSAPVIMKGMIEYDSRNVTFMAGNDFSGVSIQTGNIGTVYELAQVTGIAAATAISDKVRYPYFSRISSSGVGQIRTMIDALLYYQQITRCKCWTEVALVSSTNPYGVELAQMLITNAGDDITILVYQQFLFGGPLDTGEASDYDVELREIQNSGARVIVAPIYFAPWSGFIRAANEYGLVGDNYVWVTTSALTGTSNFSFLDDDVLEYCRGMLGMFDFYPQAGEKYDNFVQRWAELDPVEYPGAGNGVYPHYFTQMGYDSIFAVAKTVELLDKAGELNQTRVPAQTWTNAYRSLQFDGVTGPISLDENGDRIVDYSVNYYNPDARRWFIAAKWTPEHGIEKIADVVWHSNTTTIPDIDIRAPFNYWSCYDKEKRRDESGKEITLHTPDSSNVDEIASNYYCDNFIDCENMSDESVDCVSNYVILFIVFGVITGILILIAFLLLIFVVVFGLLLKYQRLRVASPFFLVIVLLSMVIGYCSIYAWFGKPHKVSCAFQVWLLGLPAISMIIALCAKTYRIWKIFKSDLKRQTITDFTLLALWIIGMIPAIIIVVVWTIVSTPTAAMQERDGEEHYICATGGFTGEPGGYIFFSLLVLYGAIVLLVGAFLSIVTRKVPSLFNESKLLAISIYNLAFLSIVIIPVFLVVNPYNPFIAWILRTCAILYAFTATMILQFGPPVLGIIVLDGFRNKNLVVDTKLVSSTTTAGISTSLNSKN